MSDAKSNRRGSGSLQPRTKRKGSRRGGQRPSTARVRTPLTDELELIEEPIEPVVRRPSRPRAAAAIAGATAVTLSRDAEYAYIRADMRRLVMIAGALLALMLAIMVLINR